MAAVAYRGRVSSPAVRANRAHPGARPAGPRRRGRARPAVAGLTTTVLAAVGVWLTWRVFVGTAAGQRVDQAVFQGAAFGRTRLWAVAEPVLEIISVPYIAVVLALAVVIAIARRRWALAVQVALLMGGANLTTQLLKYVVLDRPDLGSTYVGANTLPSGHTTAAASVSAALVFVVPPRGRPWAAVLGAVYTAGTGVSTLIGRWHRPSDVVAAVLVVLAWSGVACAFAAVSHPRTRADRADGPALENGDASTATGELLRLRARGRRAPVLGVAGAFLVLAGLAAALPAAWALHQSWTTPGALATRAELLVAYGGGAFGVVAASALAFAVLLAIRQRAGQAA